MQKILILILGGTSWSWVFCGANLPQLNTTPPAFAMPANNSANNKPSSPAAQPAPAPVPDWMKTSPWFGDGSNTVTLDTSLGDSKWDMIDAQGILSGTPDKTPDPFAVPNQDVAAGPSS